MPKTGGRGVWGTVHGSPFTHKENDAPRELQRETGPHGVWLKTTLHPWEDRRAGARDELRFRFSPSWLLPPRTWPRMHLSSLTGKSAPMGLCLPYRRRSVDAGSPGRWPVLAGAELALAFLPTAAHRRAHATACPAPTPRLLAL